MRKGVALFLVIVIIINITGCMKLLRLGKVSSQNQSASSSAKNNSSKLNSLAPSNKTSSSGSISQKNSVTSSESTIYYEFNIIGGWYNDNYVIIISPGGTDIPFFYMDKDKDGNGISGSAYIDKLADGSFEIKVYTEKSEEFKRNLKFINKDTVQITEFGKSTIKTLTRTDETTAENMFNKASSVAPIKSTFSVNDLVGGWYSENQYTRSFNVALEGYTSPTKTNFWYDILDDAKVHGGVVQYISDRGNNCFYITFTDTCQRGSKVFGLTCTFVDKNTLKIKPDGVQNAEVYDRRSIGGVKSDMYLS